MTRFLFIPTIITILTTSTSLKSTVIEFEHEQSSLQLSFERKQSLSQLSLSTSDICDTLLKTSQKVDHFNYQSTKTFEQRYIFADPWDCKDKCLGILFYTGNEAAITGFCKNERFMETIARKNFFQILFVEHRYYGDSNPEGEEDPEFKFLTVEQALQDFIQVVRKVNIHDLPVIAFGGSYGGMLSAWIRLKYPHVIRGAVAGSAPVTYSRDYENFDCDDYLKIVSDTFGSCKNQIKSGFSSISGFSVGEVTKTFNFCDTVNDDFTTELVDAFVGIAMANYPVENSFLIPGLPKWPAKSLCKQINSVGPGVKVVEKVVQMIFNGTGSASRCLPYNGIFSAIKNRPNSIKKAKTLSNKRPTDPINFSMDAWEYQTCTQLPMPVCHSKFDIFPNSPNPTRESEQKYCSEKFNSKIDSNWLKNEMGFFEDGRQFSNIIFTNGKYDPWRAGAVPKSAENKENDVILINIEEGAHHSELFAPGEDDPESIVHARNMIEEYVLKWALS